MKSVLEQLGEKHNPSKKAHGYLPVYATYFERNRMEVKSFMEIGLQRPNSINMWAEYFPNAQIYGVDIDPSNKQFENDRVKVFIGDQGDEKFLRSLPNDIDIIVEDGSHLPDHMLINILELVPKLKDGGIYACEDMLEATIYRRKVFDFLKSLCDNVNYWPKDFRDKYQSWNELNTFEGDENATWWDKNILGVCFYRFLTIIHKGTNPEKGTAYNRLGGIPQNILFK